MNLIKTFQNHGKQINSNELGMQIRKRVIFCCTYDIGSALEAVVVDALLLADSVPAIVTLARVCLLRVVLLGVLSSFSACFHVPGFGVGAHGTLGWGIDIGYWALLFSRACILLLLGAEGIASLLVGGACAVIGVGASAVRRVLVDLLALIHRLGGLGRVVRRDNLASLYSLSRCDWSIRATLLGLIPRCGLATLDGSGKILRVVRALEIVSKIAGGQSTTLAIHGPGHIPYHSLLSLVGQPIFPDVVTILILSLLLTSNHYLFLRRDSLLLIATLLTSTYSTRIRWWLTLYRWVLLRLLTFG